MNFQLPGTEYFTQLILYPFQDMPVFGIKFDLCRQFGESDRDGLFRHKAGKYRTEESQANHDFGLSDPVAAE